MSFGRTERGPEYSEASGIVEACPCMRVRAYLVHYDTAINSSLSIFLRLFFISVFLSLSKMLPDPKKTNRNLLIIF